MSESKLNPPVWAPTAKATKQGWVDPVTGELLEARNDLILKEIEHEEKDLQSLKVEPDNKVAENVITEPNASHYSQYGGVVLHSKMTVDQVKNLRELRDKHNEKA